MSDASGSAPDPAPIFAALGDRTRLALLGRLGDGNAQSITALSAETHLTRQAVTKHLRVLERAGLVHALKQGRESRFAIQPQRIEEAKSYLDRVAQQWDDALSRIRTFVEI
jgi:DNA-binding transcriptional ArsR family regulator